jgi:hypothetical protein
MMRASMVAVLAATFLAVPILAQSRVGYLVGAGLLSPSGNFATQATSGWMGTAGLSVSLGQSRWRLEPTLFYGHAADEGNDGPASTMMGGEIGFGYELGSGAVAPYLSGGSGILQHRIDGSNNGPAPAPDTQVLLQLGGGLGFALGRTRLVLDARYTHAENTRFMTYIVGLGFGGGGQR